MHNLQVARKRILLKKLIPDPGSRMLFSFNKLIRSRQEIDFTSLADASSHFGGLDQSTEKEVVELLNYHRKAA